MDASTSDKSKKKTAGATTTRTTSADAIGNQPGEVQAAGAVVVVGDPQSTDPSTSSSTKKKKKSNILLRVGEKVGIIEQTRIAPEFIQDIEKYNKYYEVADDLVGSLEGVLQKNPRILASGRIEALEKQDPLEDTARACRLIYELYEKEPKFYKLWQIFYGCFRNMAKLHREIQLNGRRAIRKLRRFVSKDHLQMLEEQRKLLYARDIMDSARHDLRQTKTSEEVEHFGKLYEGCVHDFDCQAAKVEAYILVLPNNRIWHIREVHEIFDLLGEYHQNVAKTLESHLAQALALIPSEFIQKPSKGLNILRKKSK
uniref:BAR domain-containing protein n=1 Tax=Panagrolaimus sp. PS1159 TaxID=55785 RepID=A0AC35EZM0_9BILA